MLSKMVNLVKSAISPPKPGDIYYGDSADFVRGKFLEKIFHRMKAKDGESDWVEAVGPDSYKITILSDQPLYYICKAEVLAMSTNGLPDRWLPRCIKRRIPKIKFKKMVLEDLLKKS